MKPNLSRVRNSINVFTGSPCFVISCFFCVCVCYNKKYSPRVSICMKISALVQECTFRLCRTAWHSFYASQLFLFP